MEKKTLTFELEQDENWYVVLPHWPFAHRHLQMVAGADDMLDRLADKAYAERMELTMKRVERSCTVIREVMVGSLIQSTRCRITFDVYLGRSFFDERVGDDFIYYVRNSASLTGGAHYGRTSKHDARPLKQLPRKMWLCPVTLFVCREYPQCIAIDPHSINIEVIH